MPLVPFPELWNIHMLLRKHVAVLHKSVECLWRAFVTFASNCYLKADRHCYCTGGWIIGFVLSTQTLYLRIKAFHQVWRIQTKYFKQIWYYTWSFYVALAYLPSCSIFSFLKCLCSKLLAAFEWRYFTICWKNGKSCCKSREYRDVFILFFLCFFVIFVRTLLKSNQYDFIACQKQTF